MNYPDWDLFRETIIVRLMKTYLYIVAKYRQQCVVLKINKIDNMLNTIYD